MYFCLSCSLVYQLHRQRCWPACFGVTKLFEGKPVRNRYIFWQEDKFFSVTLPKNQLNVVLVSFVTSRLHRFDSFLLSIIINCCLPFPSFSWNMNPLYLTQWRMQIQSFGVVIQQFVPPLQSWVKGKCPRKLGNAGFLFSGKDVFASKKQDFPFNPSIIIHGNLIFCWLSPRDPHVGRWYSRKKTWPSENRFGVGGPATSFEVSTRNN